MSRENSEAHIAKPDPFLTRWVFDRIIEMKPPSVYMPYLGPETLNLAHMLRQRGDFIRASCCDWLDWQEAGAYLLSGEETLDIEVMEALTQGLEDMDSEAALLEMLARSVEIENQRVRAQAIAALRKTVRYYEAMERALGRADEHSITAVLGYYMEIVKTEVSQATAESECLWTDPGEDVKKAEQASLFLHLGYSVTDETELWRRALEKKGSPWMPPKGEWILGEAGNTAGVEERIAGFLSRAVHIPFWFITVNHGFALDRDQVYDIISNHKRDVMVKKKYVLGSGAQPRREESLFIALDA